MTAPFRKIGLLLVLFLLSACASHKLPIWKVTDTPPGTRTTIPVFFATTRPESDFPKGSPEYLKHPFGHRVALDHENPTIYGRVLGNVKRMQTSLGACEPSWWDQVQAPGKIKARYPITDVTILDVAAFSKELRTQLNVQYQNGRNTQCAESTDLASPKRRILLYIHGFNDSFEEAAGNAAQLVYDLDIRAMPVIFSWPSQGSVLGYPRDETYVLRSRAALQQLIATLLRNEEKIELYIVAHSLGTRLALAALQDYNRDRNQQGPIASKLILYAADRDILLFETENAQSLPAMAKSISIYANTHDIPLAASRRINGGYALGDFDGAPYTGENFTTIDVSFVRQGRLNHTGFEDSPIIVQQIQEDLLGISPDQRSCLCKIDPATTISRNPTGKAPFYRIATDRPQCPFQPPVYIPVKGAANCP